MIETLTNLKNNRAKKSDGGTDTIERMKKFLSGLSKKYHGKSHQRFLLFTKPVFNSGKGATTGHT